MADGALSGRGACPRCGKLPKAFEGYSVTLKPAFEPIILARKPLSEGNVAANVLRHGTGAINVDACRVVAAAGDYDHPGNSGIEDKRNVYGSFANGNQSKPHATGRWPANLLHDGSPEVEQAFAAFGERATSSPGTVKRRRDHQTCSMAGTLNTLDRPEVAYGDTGSASRFFYTAKADARDRAGSRHPTVKPASLMRWLVRLVTPPGGTILDPFAGTGSTGLAADQLGMNAVLIERDAQYAADARHKIERDGGLFAEVRAADPSELLRSDLDAAYQRREGDLFADAVD